MTTLGRAFLAVFLAAASVPALAANFDCNPGNVEEFRYHWRLRGGVRFIAGLVFPTSGIGNLRTTFASGGEHAVRSELLITAPNGRAGGFYAYESHLDSRGAKTLMTYHGYAWGKKSRSERTDFDYAKGLARMKKQTPDEVENRVKKLPEGQQHFRDVLTAIYFLRQNAHNISRPLQTSIYSDGAEYPVVFRPNGRKTFTLGAKTVVARGFEIVDAPGGKKWSGGVKVWVSDDDRRIPIRIDISQSVAVMQLDLQSIEHCALIAQL